MVDSIVIVCYFVAMIGVGWHGMYRAKDRSDYLVAGRRLGYGLYAGTLSAVVLGGASTIGGVRLGYLHGLSGMWLVFMLGLGIVVLSVFLSKRLSSLGVYTVSEMLGRRYGVSSRIIGGCVMVAYDLMVAVTATLAIGTVFDVILDVPRIPAILLGGGVVVAYSVLGGMWSITLTDILQFGIMTIGIFVILLPMSLADVGGWSGLRDSLPSSYFDLGAIGGDTIFTYFLIYFFGIIIGQDIWQRVFTARDARVAKRAGLFAGLYCMLYAAAGAVIGMAAQVLLPDLDNPDNAFAAVTRSVLPAGLTGLVLAAALAAIMSTASACLLAASTILSNDVARGSSASVTRDRMATLGVGLAMVVIAVAVQDVVGALTVAYNLLVGGLLVTILGGLIWKRATPRAALASMASGSIVVIVLMVTEGVLANAPTYGGLAASTATFILVSFVTKPAEPTSDIDVSDKAVR